jgi:hypothetical protein
MTSYDGIGISRYMLVYDRHISVYDKTSALILVMATDVLGIRPLISGKCLLILPRFVPGCFRDWYMLAHPALLFFAAAMEGENCAYPIQRSHGFEIILKK